MTMRFGNYGERRRTRGKLALREWHCHQAREVQNPESRNGGRSRQLVFVLPWLYQLTDVSVAGEFDMWLCMWLEVLE